MKSIPISHLESWKFEFELMRFRSIYVRGRKGWSMKINSGALKYTVFYVVYEVTF